MWYPFVLLLFVGAAVANHDGAWKTGHEYKYLIHTRTLTSLDKLTAHFSGIATKGILNIQVKSPEKLLASISNPKYTRRLTLLRRGWESEIHDRELRRELPLSRKVFEIRIKHGVIRNILVDKNVPTWEVNMLKSIVSQLQVDAQGENARRDERTQVPESEQSFAMFTAVEDSVSGKCEVLYDIKPLSPYHNKPALVPIPDLRGDGYHFDIIKTKNYSRCEQRPSYHFGIRNKQNLGQAVHNNDKYISESTNSRVVISGHLKRYTIQSSVMTNTISVNPRIVDYQSGSVYSKVNLTLIKMNTIDEKSLMKMSANALSTGNLVYTYNSPFTHDEQRKHHYSSYPSESSVDESDEENWKDRRHDFSSSEEQDFYQPKPKLDEAPEYPLLPFFIGNMGKNIHLSEKVNVMRVTKDLIHNIIDDLQNPNEISSREMLEKFTILARIIRTMNTEQINEVESNLYVSANRASRKDVDKESNTWDILRDAVAQAGTAPALKIITKWIIEKKLEGIDAAVVVGQIPRTARAPTDEYIRMFFDMIKKPEVSRQQFLNETAPLAFAELVRYVYVDSHSHHYPVHVFGRMTSKKDKVVTDTYIPYMAEHLKIAIKDGDSKRIQTYIRALGNFAHPKILSVFEPYLEGKKQVSKFQRLIIVASLNKLVETKPDLARSVLYKIYLNIYEAYELRTKAVYLLMKTNPSLNMLQRMAEFTKYDTNYHVNSAVKSAIENIAELKQPVYQNLANKARIAKKLLHPRNYGYSSSHIHILDVFNLKKDLTDTYTFETIGSDDTNIPKVVDLHLDSNYHGFHPAQTRIGYAVSSFRNLVNRLVIDPDVTDRSQKSVVEKIARMLNIQPDDPEQIEGNFFFDSMYGEQFYPFDNHTIDAINEYLKLHYQKSFINQRNLHLNKIDSYDVTLSFPTETGLPFIHNMKTSILARVHGVHTFNIKKSADASDKKTGANMVLSNDVDLVFAHKIQGRFGFTSPFEHQQYVAGVDEKAHVYLPVKMNLEVKSMKSIDLRIHAYADTPEITVFHRSVVPYLSIYDVFDFRPVILSQNVTLPLRQRNLKKIPNTFENIFGDVIRTSAENDYYEGLDNTEEETYDKWFNTWPVHNAHYRKFDVYLNTEKENGLHVTASYDNVYTIPDFKKHSQRISAIMGKIPSVIEEQDENVIKKQFAREVSKGVQSNVVHLFNATVRTPSKSSQVYFGLTQSDIKPETEMQFLLFSNFQSRKPQQYKINLETCVSGYVRSTPDYFLDLHKLLNVAQEDEYRFEVLFGETCNDEQKIVIEGNQARTEDRLRAIMDYETVKQCQEEIKEGNKALPACEKAKLLAGLRDRYEVITEFNSDEPNMLTNKALQYISEDLVPNAKVNAINPRNAGKNTVNVKLNMSPDFNKANLTVHSSEFDIIFPPFDVTRISKVWGILPFKDDTMEEEEGDEYTCTLDKNRAVTFDNKVYPLQLEQCWHVLMTTYPEINPDNPNEYLPIPEEQKIAVLARDVNEHRREVKMVICDKVVLLKVTDNGQLIVTIDGKPVDFSQHKSYHEKDGEKTLFEIFVLSDHIIKLKSDVHEVSLLYDGQVIRVELSDEYRNAIRGLCGNFDRRYANDFVTPKNCILEKPEEFVASYAMLEADCQGHAPENKRRAEQSMCLHMSLRPSNVISDLEAGRPWTEGENWGYHQIKPENRKALCNVHHTKVVEKDEQLCFTVKPLPSCAEGCLPTELKSKKYAIYCMEKNEEAKLLRSRIEKGANPDLSQRSASEVHTFEVPITCVAA